MKKVLIPLTASVVMGLFAAVLARQMILNHRSAPDRPTSVKVVTAKVELPPGHALVAEDLVVAPIAGSVPPPNTSTDAAHLIGRVIIAPLVPGQPVLDTQLAPAGSLAGLQSLVPEGMRAITLDATDSNGMLGLLMPGSHVDVVTTAIGTSGGEPTLSRIIAQDVQVLAVGQRLTGAAAHEGEGQTAAARTVTLLVTPHDAATLDLGQAMARVRLILRGNTDHAEVDDDPVVVADLRGGAVTAQPVVQAAAPAPTPTPAPATQPAAVPAQAVPQEAPHRIVTLILGNQEQRLSFHEQPKPGPSEVSDTVPNDPFANP